MSNRSAVRTILSLAAVTTLYAGSGAMAQFRVNNGNALDANNRVGSGGVNEANNRINPWQISNAIVNGNVTGGKEFRGNVQTGDTFAFRGRSTGDSNSDRFIRSSSGVSTNGVASNNANNSTLYYGSSRAAPIPPGIAQSGLTFQQTPNGAYTPPTPREWQQVDQRGTALGSSVQTIATPSALNGPGAVDFDYAPNALSVTPSGLPQAAANGALSDYTTVRPDVTTQSLSAQQLSAVRNAVSMQQQAAPASNGPNAPAGSNTLAGQSLNDSVKSSSLPNAGGATASPLNDSVSSPMLTNSLPAAQSAEPGMVSKVVGKGGSNSTYDSLSQRRAEQEQAMRPGENAENAAKQFNDDIRARKAAEEKKKNADQPQPGAKPGAKPGATPAAVKSGAPQPLHVNSLAEPGEASGVNSLLGKAEQQMREGKFASAIDSYDAAEALAPKNALVKLGRTHAELGGSYYRRAENDLRQTLAADKNLLAGQYDLRAFLGDARLQIVQKDLSDQVQSKPTEVGSAVLLAYVYYNTGNERRAAAMLDLADKRAEGKDPFVTLLKTNWNFGNDNK